MKNFLREVPAGAKRIMLAGLVCMFGAILAAGALERMNFVSASTVKTSATCTKAEENSVKADPSDSTRFLRCRTDSSSNYYWYSYNCYQGDGSWDTANSEAKAICGSASSSSSNLGKLPVVDAASSSGSSCAKAGQNCNPLTEQDCRYDAASGMHCYCKPNSASATGSTATGGKWVKDANIASYCKVCPSDSGACSCSYKSDSTSSAETTFAMGSSICGTAGTASENFSYECSANGNYSADTTGEGHGVLFEPTAVGCLNQECKTNNGKCEDVSNTTECDDLDDNIVELMKYVKEGYISTGGTIVTSKVKNDEDKEEEIKDFISTFKKDYGSSLLTKVASKKSFYEGRSFKSEELACSTEGLQKECTGLVGSANYSYVCKAGPNGCRLWSWLIDDLGSEDFKKCKDDCEYANGLNQGFCAEEDTELDPETTDCTGNTTECSADADCQGEDVCGGDYVCNLGYCVQGCRGADDNALYEVNEYKCGGTTTTENKSFICKEGAGWEENKDCAQSNGTCSADTGECAEGGTVEEGGECATDDECKEGLVCEDGKCMSSEDAQASNAGQGGGGGETATGEGEEGDKCKKDADCGEGLVCEDGECMTEEDAQDSGKGEECTKDSDCRDDMVCQDGTCATEEEDTQEEDSGEEGSDCTSDSDCEGDMVCQDGTCATEEESGQEGDGCTNDSDCEDDLVCQDGTCMTEEEATPAAPVVTVSSPTGTVNTKTAQLNVTTDVTATCKYMDITNSGSFEASSFDSAGMTMASSGNTHIATLNSLDSNTGDSSECTKTHNIVVLCRNSKAKAGSTESIGAGQASFTVDLSDNPEYAPKVTSKMTSDSYTVANPVLKVSTNRPAECQYLDSEEGDLEYGSGEDFTTTGNYSHNVELSDLVTKEYTYQVACKDVDTCAVSEVLEINLKVTLEGGESAMKISDITAQNQTASNPTLAVITDLPSTCRYSEEEGFDYEDGKPFTNDNDYSHISSLSSLSDGDYEFYVICKENETGLIKKLEDPITTKLDRGASEDEPDISNTTDVSQSTDSPILSITTEAAATCQYSEDADFAYGDGTQFTTDGNTGHSVELEDVDPGEHTYYVLCKDVATGTVNSEPVEIVFDNSSTGGVCAELDSNDQQSDEDRDYDEDDSASKYVWRSVEDGTRELSNSCDEDDDCGVGGECVNGVCRDEFTEIDWYAGYQFTPDKDGYVNELCGYFADGQENTVTLYNGSYKELASEKVEGTDDWECVSITPVEVKTDKRYYVIARVEDGPIYYEYQSDMLPMDAEDVVVDAGIRQLGEDDFGEDIYKYDYMVFGLVDVKITFAGESEEGPEIEVEGPDDVDDDWTTLSITTDVDAECRFDREDLEYSDMTYDFGQTGGKEHEQKICDLDEGNFTFYIRCKDGDDEENDASTIIQFEVTD